jgi:hypothetical protein
MDGASQRAPLLPCQPTWEIAFMLPLPHGYSIQWMYAGFITLSRH